MYYLPEGFDLETTSQTPASGLTKQKLFYVPKHKFHQVVYKLS